MTASDDLPATSSSETVKRGPGTAVVVGDLVDINYEMVSWTTGEVVESTRNDFGGPLTVLLGAGDVPMTLEAAILGTSVRSRLMVVFEPNLIDLPTYLDPNDAYLLAVDIVRVER